MARPKTPTQILELRGSFRKNPQRRRLNEPRPQGPIGPAPERLTAEQARAWDFLVSQAAPGVLGSSDRAGMELLAMQYARSRTEQLTLSEAKQIFDMMGKFGLSPSAFQAQTRNR